MLNYLRIQNQELESFSSTGFPTWLKHSVFPTTLPMDGKKRLINSIIKYKMNIKIIIFHNDKYYITRNILMHKLSHNDQMFCM